MLAGPERRAQHPAAVQRQRGKHVEDEEHEVHIAEPGRRPRRPPAARRSSGGGQRRSGADHERDDRPRDRDPELCPGGGEHPPEASDAAEDPERDPLDLHPLPRVPDRVAELVQEQGAEEQQHRDDRHREVGAVGEPRVRLGEDGRRPATRRSGRRSAPSSSGCRSRLRRAGRVGGSRSRSCCAGARSQRGRVGLRRLAALPSRRSRSSGSTARVRSKWMHRVELVGQRGVK